VGRRNLLSVLAAGGLVAAAVSLLVLRDDPPRYSPEHPIRVTVDGGCPADVVGRNGVINPDGTDLDGLMVPTGAVGGLVCEYAPGGASLTRRIRLSQTDAARLAGDANQIGSADVGDFSCPGGVAAHDVLVFSYPGRADVDIWYERTGCITLENGYLVRPYLTPPVVAQFSAFIRDLAHAGAAVRRES
jgi:hypothetical protein